MKINWVELTSVVEHDRPNQHLVLTSDSLLRGTGEIAAGADGQRSTVALSDLLVGKDPFDIEAFLRDVKQQSDGTIEDVELISAATSAMLDLASQSIDAPLAQLLAGTVNDQARACAVGCSVGERGAELTVRRLRSRRFVAREHQNRDARCALLVGERDVGWLIVSAQTLRAAGERLLGDVAQFDREFRRSHCDGCV